MDNISDIKYVNGLPTLPFDPARVPRDNLNNDRDNYTTQYTDYRTEELLRDLNDKGMPDQVKIKLMEELALRKDYSEDVMDTLIRLVEDKPSPRLTIQDKEVRDELRQRAIWTLGMVWNRNKESVAQGSLEILREKVDITTLPGYKVLKDVIYDWNENSNVRAMSLIAMVNANPTVNSMKYVLSDVYGDGNDKLMLIAIGFLEHSQANNN